MNQTETKPTTKTARRSTQQEVKSTEGSPTSTTESNQKLRPEFVQ